MSAPDADLLGDIDVFAVRAQWALAAGQPLGRPARLLPGPPGTAAGIRWRWRAFASANRLALPPGQRLHHLGSGVVAGLGPPHRPLQRRLRAGVGGSCGDLTRPASRVWPETPYMLGLFLAWPSHCSRPSWPPGRDPEQRSWIRRRM